jgi:hypothetical protein
LKGYGIEVRCVEALVKQGTDLRTIQDYLGYRDQFESGVHQRVAGMLRRSEFTQLARAELT